MPQVHPSSSIPHPNSSFQGSLQDTFKDQNLENGLTVQDTFRYYQNEGLLYDQLHIRDHHMHNAWICISLSELCSCNMLKTSSMLTF